MAHRLRLIVLLSVLGCGPPRPAADGETTTDASSTGTSGSDDSETETDGSEPGDPTTSGFVPSSDIHADPCDPFAQDCPEGEKCVPFGSAGVGWDHNKCVPVLGEQGPGEPCHYAGVVDSTDDCDATSFCWNVTQEGIGTCAPFCLGSADNPICPDAPPGCADYHCVINSDATINLCVLECDPLAQDCGESLGCFWANDGFWCVFTTEERSIGEPCGYINDCVSGAGCVDTELLPDCAGESCCAPFCDLAALLDPCPDLLAGTSCMPFWEPTNPGCELGMCLGS
ncbi:MAG: hypothetical protein R6X02_09425 [Enhygromyxa sp.]